MKTTPKARNVHHTQRIHAKRAKYAGRGHVMKETPKPCSCFACRNRTDDDGDNRRSALLKVVRREMLAAILLIVSATALAAPPPNTGNCLNAEELRLVEIVNAYRVQNGRPALQASKWLSTTGQWHVWDLAENNPITATCNMHSWSGARPDLWQAVCYTPDHAQSSQMWWKPSQISAGRYTGFGYENAVTAATADSALAWWQSSSAHNAVILQQGVWAGVNFTGLGVGLWGGYATLWFGDGVDPDGNMQACQIDPIWYNGFE